MLSPSSSYVHPHATIPLSRPQFWLWNASDVEGADYMQKILPYLDNHPNIVGYQAFGGLWEGRFINAQGNGLTPAGSVYRDL
jgi:hypothetical protein